MSKAFEKIGAGLNDAIAHARGRKSAIIADNSAWRSQGRGARDAVLLMRTNGKITHWNAEKGYGFITPSSGAKQVFVHIRAFRKRDRQPEINQLVTFELSVDRQGRPCAEDVTRVGDKPQRETRRGGSLSSLTKAAWALVIVAMVGVFAYSRINEYLLRSDVTTSPLVSPYLEPTPKFQCDGRTHCSHMTSCEEAFFFIENCAGTQMDGDGDGVPCESQWCG